MTNTKKYSNIKRLGILALATAGLAASALTYTSCSEKSDNIVGVIDCGTCTKAYDLCVDVNFDINYVQNSLPGVTNITFKRVPNDDCGYISDRNGNIIGREEPWQVMSVEGIGTNDSLVDIVRRDIVGEVILNKVWLQDDNGEDASIIANIPNSATYIEVDLDSREIPDTTQWVTRNGKRMIPGVGGYVRNGSIDILVYAYGERRSSRNSTHQLIKIVNPTLMDYKPR